MSGRESGSMISDFSELSRMFDATYRVKSRSNSSDHQRLRHKIERNRGSISRIKKSVKSLRHHRPAAVGARSISTQIWQNYLTRELVDHCTNTLIKSHVLRLRKCIIDRILLLNFIPS